MEIYVKEVAIYYMSSMKHWNGGDFENVHSEASKSPGGDLLNAHHESWEWWGFMSKRWGFTSCKCSLWKINILILTQTAPHRGMSLNHSPFSVMMVSVCELPWLLMCFTASSTESTTSTLHSSPPYSDLMLLTTPECTGRCLANLGPGWSTTLLPLRASSSSWKAGVLCRDLWTSSVSMALQAAG